MTTEVGRQPRRRVWQLGFQALALLCGAGAVAAAAGPCSDRLTVLMGLGVAGAALSTAAAISIPWVHYELGERIARRRRKRVVFAIVVSLLAAAGLATIVIFVASAVQSSHCPVEHAFS